jgi:hypothetical protein
MELWKIKIMFSNGCVGYIMPDFFSRQENRIENGHGKNNGQGEAGPDDDSIRG